VKSPWSLASTPATPSAHVPWLYTGLKIAGAAYVLYLAWTAIGPASLSAFETRELPRDSRWLRFPSSSPHPQAVGIKLAIDVRTPATGCTSAARTARQRFILPRLCLRAYPQRKLPPAPAVLAIAP
jgi:hypothetical protein